MAAGRYVSAAASMGCCPCLAYIRASLAAVVVFPEPWSPISMTTVGGWGAMARRWPLPPSSSTSSPCTTFTTCWAGVRDLRTSCPTAFSFTRSMKARTTLKLTSASSRATRTSRSASWMLSSVRRPRPPSRSKIACSRVLRESSMEAHRLRNYSEDFNFSFSGIAGVLESTLTRERQLPGGRAHALDLGAGVGGPEDRRAGDEHGGTLGDERRHVLELHPPVHRDVDRAGGHAGPDVAQLGVGGGDEALATKSGVYRHHEDQIEVVEHPVEDVGRRARVEGGARLRPELADLGQRPLQMRARLDVDGDLVGAGGREIGQVALGLHDHQVDIEGQAGSLTDRLYHHGADREVRHEPAVHDVDVEQVGPGGLDLGDIVGEGSEVCGEDRGRDLDHGPLYSANGRAFNADQPGRREPVGPVVMWQAADEAVGVGGYREFRGRVEAEVGPGVEERAHDGLVLLRLQRTGRVDQSPARLHHRGRRGEDRALASGPRHDIVGRAPPLDLGIASQHAQVRARG